MEKITATEQIISSEKHDLQVVPGASCSAFLEYVDRSEATRKAYRSNLRSFSAWLAYSGISRPVRTDVIAYRDWLQTYHQAIRYDETSGWSWRLDKNGNPYMVRCNDYTAKQRLQALHRFFSWAAMEGLYPDITAGVNMPRVNTDIHRREALEASDVSKVDLSIREHAITRTSAAVMADKDSAGRTTRSEEQGRRLRAMFLLAVSAGLRTCEISRANCGDIEMIGGQAWLYVRGKGYSGGGAAEGAISGKIPLAQEAYTAIRLYTKERASPSGAADPLFVATGNRSKGQRLSPSTVSRMLKAALVEAGYESPRLSAHSLRNTAAETALTATGDNVYQVQHFMRHKSPRTTEIYLNKDLSRQDAEIAGKVMRAYMEGKPEDQW